MGSAADALPRPPLVPSLETTTRGDRDAPASSIQRGTDARPGPGDRQGDPPRALRAAGGGAEALLRRVAHAPLPGSPAGAARARGREGLRAASPLADEPRRRDAETIG